MKQGIKKIITLSLFVPFFVSHADDEYEWDQEHGYHQEEWYDPSDWFNDDGDIDYEYDYPYYSDAYWYDPYYSPNWYYDSWYNDFDYDYNPNYSYSWNAEEQEWDTGLDVDQYDYSDKSATYARDDSTSQKNIKRDGEIQSFQHVNVNQDGAYEKHTFVKIYLEDGSVEIVDLGRKRDLNDLNLSSGKRIEIEGKEATVGNKDVLLASMIRVGGHEFQIDQNRQNYRFNGTIKDYRMASLSGARDDHLLVRFELEKGKEMIVDFGPKAKLKDLNLRKGDTVQVQGRKATVNGKSILVAKSVRVDGEKKLQAKS